MFYSGRVGREIGRTPTSDMLAVFLSVSKELAQLLVQVVVDQAGGVGGVGYFSPFARVGVAGADVLPIFIFAAE